MASTWVGGPHPTSGLAGYPARDFGAPGNAPVYAWDQLRVRRISGASGYRGGGFGGLNLYLEDRRGREYFATHLEGLRVKVGDVVRPGQQIAVVGNYGTPHVHLGYTGGDPVSVLGIKPEFLFTPGGAAAGSKAIQAQPAAPPKGGGGITGAIGGAISGIGSVSGVDIIEGVTGSDLPDVDRNPLDVITAPIDAIRWVAGNWDRMLEVFGGLLLVLVGLVLMGRSLGVTKTRLELVERNLPGGEQRVVEREAARAEERAYVRAASSAGRARARGQTVDSGRRRRRVRLPSDEPPPARPRSNVPEEIPF